MKCVILAGGRGRRLWPLSRPERPKQFCALVSEKTMIEETFARLRRFFPPTDIFVSTSRDYLKQVRTLLPEVSEENIIAEPVSRNTAAGTALLTAVLAERFSPEETVVLFPADHAFADWRPLAEAVSVSEDFLRENPEYIVTFGIPPRTPETAYGYVWIEEGEAFVAHRAVKRVRAFVEKPPRETAERYLAEGNYFWNAGMFAFSLGAMAEKFRRRLPRTWEIVETAAAAEERREYERLLRELYPDCEDISLDYAIMEKEAARTVLIKLRECGWSDIGSWAALKDFLSSRRKDNVLRGKIFDGNCRDLLAFCSSGEKPVILLGLENTAVVDTPEGLLVAAEKDLDKLSEITKRLSADDSGENLK